MDLNDRLMSISVRIESIISEDKTKILGTGVLWEPNETSEYMYIFTARHVVLGENNLIIRYINENQKPLQASIDDSDIACYEDVGVSDDELPINDVAVLRCKRNKIKSSNLYIYKLSQTKNLIGNKNMFFRGFPSIITQKTSFIASNKPVHIVLETKDELKKRFTYAIRPITRIDAYDGVNEQTVGFSGSGIFLDSDSELLLIGIHSGSLGKNGDLNTFIGMEAGLIIDICKKKSWDIPILCDDVSGNLQDAVDNFYDEIDNDELIEVMHELIQYNFEHVIKSDFCGISKVCENTSCPHQCQVFRNYLLIILSILKYLNDSITFEKAEISNEEKKVPVKYVCCDGETELSKVSLTTFISSLKNDYLEKQKVENNTLILWGSKKKIQGKERHCTPKRFKKILKDIKLTGFQTGGFDIKRGFIQPRELAVIEIDTLVKKIEEEELDNMKKFIEESIKDI